jgi:hypothetical protein
MKQNTQYLYPIVAVLVVGVAVLFYVNSGTKTSKTPTTVTQTTQQQDADTAALLAEVSKLIALPKGEKPTVATVVEPSKLISQPFFRNTKVDDRVLVYMEARQAILYRPSEHRIIEVAPVFIGDPSTIGATFTTTTQKK